MTNFGVAERDVFQGVADCAASLGFEAYLVGGLVRDLFAGELGNRKDLDFVIVGEAPTLARNLEKLWGGSLSHFTPFLTLKM